MIGLSVEEITEKYDEIVSFSELGESINSPLNTYSSGMLLRLAFSINISINPRLMYIDEILSVGDFTFRQKCLARIRELREETAFVLVSHSMSNIRMFCDRTLVLDSGREIYIGDTDKAIEIYESLEFPDEESIESRRSEILKPQFHNESAISEVLHYWSDLEGNRIEKIEFLESLYFCLSFSQLIFLPFRQHLFHQYI